MPATNATIANAVSTFGDPARPAILFLHGIRLGRAIWTQHATALAHRYHVITVDLPGHGALADIPFTEDRLTALLDRIIDELACSPPLIVGYSLGGFVAMRYASQFPQRTSGLLLAGCTLDFEAWKWWPYGVSVRLTQLLPDAWLGMLLHTTLYMTLPRQWLDVVENIAFNRKVLSQTSDIVRSQRSALDGISAYRKPVEVVNGQYDLVFRVDERRFLHRLPQARLRIIRGTDHTAPLQRVGEFTSIVDAFAGRVFPAF